MINKKIGIATVNYNQYQQTQEFLESLTFVKKTNEALVYIADPPVDWAFLCQIIIFGL